jgi:hypothetical protein
MNVMKKMMILATLMTIVISASAMPYTQARQEALFLSDKMAYELQLTAPQYDAVYEINLDYFLKLDQRGDIYGVWWSRRNTDLQYVLTAYQYNKYMGMAYFFRPVRWHEGHWDFNVYNHYSNHGRFFRGHPTIYNTYRGGNNLSSSSHYAGRHLNEPNHPNHHGNVGQQPGHNGHPGGNNNHHQGSNNNHPSGNNGHSSGNNSHGNTHNNGNASGHSRQNTPAQNSNTNQSAGKGSFGRR